MSILLSKTLWLRQERATIKLMGNKRKKPKISLQNKEHKYIIDRVVLFTGLIGPIASVPQAIEIFSKQDAQGVSLVTWGFFIVTNASLLIYSIVHRLPALIISNVLWVVIEVVVVLGILLYS
jgi:uncharacterized protein with PQ loop repeat